MSGRAAPAVAGRGLAVTYDGRLALAPSDFAVPAGAVTAVIGPNGSGKSTLLHAMAGLVPPAAGSVEVFGASPEAARARIAYVLQIVRVNDLVPITVREVVTMGRYARRGAFGRLDRTDQAVVDAALERLDVADLASRHLRDLSGGQRQRVFVAQGLAQEADLLLLDEPVTGLDQPSHERIDVVVEEERDAGSTIVMTTHDVAEARRADHVLLLGGAVVAAGAPGEVLTEARLAQAYGAQLLHVEDRHVLDDPHHHGSER